VGDSDAERTVRERTPARRGTQPNAPTSGTIGRYEVIRVLGEGGMGSVLLAHDPELDRKVALKLLQPEVASSLDALEAQARLLREAQATARLQHANVVAIHDVGKHEDQVFLALDYIEGTTLREWLKAKRTPREIVDAFVQAGRGLAAAHRAGLVHRDFKPENVLVSKDGRVLVTDFGLARLADESEPAGEDKRASASLLTTPITSIGGVAGTPGYIAPEQYRGESSDARSDQFAFCVSLHEGLYGVRPFGSTRADDYQDRMSSGKLEPPVRTDAPTRLRALVVRGLSSSPTDRFESMDELVHALAHDPARRRWQIAGVAAAVAVCGGLAALLWGRAGAAPCEGADVGLAGVWDLPSRTALHARFLATGGPRVPYVLGAVDRGLDRWAHAWVSQRVETCRDTRERGVRSEAAMDARMTCLDGDLAQARALVHLLRTADPSIVDKSPDAVAALGAPSCSEALTEVAPPPTDPAVRAQVERSTQRLADAQALYRVGKYADARATADPELASAKQIGYRPLEARWLVLHGSILHKIGDTAKAREETYAGWAAAEATGDVRTKLAAVSQLVGTAAITGSFEETERLYAQGKAMLEHHPDPMRQAALDDNYGLALANQGRCNDAIPVYREAVELAPVDTVEHQNDSVNLAFCLADQGKLSEAAKAMESALAWLDQNYGPGSRIGDGWRFSLAQVRANQGRHADAFALLKLNTGGSGRGSIFAREMALLGHTDEALATIRDTLANIEKKAGPDSRPAMYQLAVRITILHSLKRYDDAAPDREHLLHASEKLGDHDRGMNAIAQLLQADALAATGHASDAIAIFKHLEPYLATAEADTRIEVAEKVAGALLDVGKRAEAIAEAEPAVKSCDTLELPPLVCGNARFVLARALAADGGDKSRVTALVRAARTDFTRTDEVEAKARIAAVDAFAPP
jgi:tetratricopeptide (TPR) repeat protein